MKAFNQVTIRSPRSHTTDFMTLRAHSMVNQERVLVSNLSSMNFRAFIKLSVKPKIGPLSY